MPLEGFTQKESAALETFAEQYYNTSPELSDTWRLGFARYLVQYGRISEGTTNDSDELEVLPKKIVEMANEQVRQPTNTGSIRFEPEYDNTLENLYESLLNTPGRTQNGGVHTGSYYRETSSRFFNTSFRMKLISIGIGRQAVGLAVHSCNDGILVAAADGAPVSAEYFMLTDARGPIALTYSSYATHSSQQTRYPVGLLTAENEAQTFHRIITRLGSYSQAFYQAKLDKYRAQLE